MNHTKIILALIAVLNMTATPMAQTTPTGHFEWAKGYTFFEDACHIQGAVTDSVGNLYILGQYNYYAAWDGEPFLLVSDFHPQGTPTRSAKGSIYNARSLSSPPSLST